MADLILIPVLALLFVGAKRYDNGFNKDYLSKDNTLALKGACALSIVLLHIGGNNSVCCICIFLFVRLWNDYRFKK